MYAIIYEWMTQDLGLTGADLLVYAAIHAFSCDGRGSYFGGNAGLCRLTGLGERCVRKTLRELEERGLLEKSEGFHAGTRCFDYVALCQGGQITRGHDVPGAQNSPSRGHAVPGEGAQNAGSPLSSTNIQRSINNKLNIKIRGTKEQARAREDISLPYGSQEFRDAWETLCKQPKWRGKSADALKAAAKKLGEVTEPEALAMMTNAVLGNWQGLFPLKPAERAAALATAPHSSYNEQLAKWNAEYEQALKEGREP